MRSALALLVVALGLLLSFVAAAQTDAPPKAFPILSKEWARTLADAEAFVTAGGQTLEQHKIYASALRGLVNDAKAVREQAETEAGELQPLLDALGPPPGEGQPAEAREIALQRRELTQSLTFLNTRAKQAELAAARATALQTEISQAMRQRFVDRLFERQGSPLAPSVVEDAVPQLGSVVATLLRAPVDWYAALSPERRTDVWREWRMLLILAAAVFAWLVRRGLLLRFGPDPDNATPSYARRLLAALASAIANGIIPSAVLAAIAVRIRSDASLNAGLGGTVVTQLCIALIFIAMAAALARAALSPQFPEWRLTGLAPDSARRLSRRIVFLAAVYAFDQMFVRTTASLAISLDLHTFWLLLSGSIEALGLVLLTQADVWLTDADTQATPSAAQPAAAGGEAKTAKPTRSHTWMALRIAIAVASVGAVVAMLFGYVQLGSFVILSLVRSTVVVGALYLVLRLFREVIVLVSSARVRDRRLRFGLVERPDLRFWLGLAVDALLFVGASYLLLLIWGVPSTDVERWLLLAVGGFTIGGVTISLADIGTAAVVFAVGLFVTNRLRGVLHRKVLPRTRLDVGVRNSLATGAGYVGFVLSAVLAIGVVGIDLSNLAIIAGALSVGIGFGLQNIVNNFVSGLILLAERPVKVGDWVIVGNHQGHVKHISVRATEIQTFDRSSVIIPNSELLSNAVTNWTYKDVSGRVMINVGIAYGSDTRKVRELLLECAAAHEEVVSWPQPFVIFANFGASSLDFALYAYLRDVEKRLSVSSDLRFAIDQAFRDAGIEIPYGQHDVHLRGLDRLLDGLRALLPDGRPEDAGNDAARRPQAVPPDISPTAPPQRDVGPAETH